MFRNGWWQGVLWLQACCVVYPPAREVLQLLWVPLLAPMGKLCFSAVASAAPGGGWPQHCPWVVLPCWAVGQGWLGREGSIVPWWPPAWPGHTVPRHCEGWGGISPAAMALIPEGDGWISGAPVRLSAHRRVVALLHLLSEHSKLQHPAAPAAICVRVLVYKGCTFLSTSKVQLLRSRGMTKPES